MLDFFKNYWCDFTVLILGLLGTGYLRAKYKTTRYALFISYIPNLWTSLGILGTFVSILLSLSNLNFKTVLDISKLVQMIAPAFSTSIIGIIGALASSIVIRIHRATVEVREDDTYAASIRNIERQVSIMGSGAKEMAKEMGREVVAAAGEGLRTSMIQHVRAMVRAVEKEEKNFDEVAAKIIANLNEVAKTHKVSMSDLMTQYAEEAGNVKEKCATAIADIMVKTSEEVEKISQVHLSHLDEISKSQIAHLESIDQSIKMSVESAYTKLAEQVVLVSEELSRVAAVLPEIREDFEVTGRSVKVASDSFAVIKTDLEKVRNELRAAVDENSSRMENTVSFIEKTVKRDSENTTQTELLLKRADKAISSMENASFKMLNAAEKAIKGPSARTVGSAFTYVPSKKSPSVPPAKQLYDKKSDVVTNKIEPVEVQREKTDLKKMFFKVFSRKNV